MKRVAMLFLILIGACGSQVQSGVGERQPHWTFPLAPPEARNYAITFDEEFDGPISLRDEKDTSTDRGRWNQRYWYGAAGFYSSHDDWSQGTVMSRSWHGFDLLSQSNGILSMRGDKRPANAPAEKFGNRPYLNSLLTTEGSFSQRYGYFEARLRAPAAAGYWPTFWLWCLNDSAEIDIAEFQTRERGSVYGSTHQRTTPGTFRKLPTQVDKTDEMAPSGFDITKWHVYGLLWTENTLEWLIDGKITKKYDNHPFHEPCFVILSNGPGGWSDENKVVSQFGASLDVDYLRVGALR